MGGWAEREEPLVTRLRKKPAFMCHNCIPATFSSNAFPEKASAHRVDEDTRDPPSSPPTPPARGGGPRWAVPRAVCVRYRTATLPVHPSPSFLSALCVRLLCSVGVAYNLSRGDLSFPPRRTPGRPTPSSNQGEGSPRHAARVPGLPSARSNRSPSRSPEPRVWLSRARGRISTRR